MDRSKIGQFFKNIFKKNDTNTPTKSGEIINIIFARCTNDERVKLLNFIDKFIIDEFKIKESNLPWLNSNYKSTEEDWDNFFVYFRLGMARILETYISKNKRLN